MHAVVTAHMPQYTSSAGGEVFDSGSMKVRVFTTEDDAHSWAIENPHYITEVVPVEVMPDATTP